MGMFDGAIQQAQKMIDQEMTTGPASVLFNTLKGQVDALRQTVATGAAADVALDQHVAALDSHLVAMDAHMRANTAMMQSLVNHLGALNAHPTVAAKPPA